MYILSFSVEKGRIFVFLSKNGTIPQGNVTLSCPSYSTVVPCTSIVVSAELLTQWSCHTSVSVSVLYLFRQKSYD